MPPCWGAGCLDPACLVARRAACCSQLLLVMVPTVAQPAACFGTWACPCQLLCPGAGALSRRLNGRGPSGGVACGSLLTRPAGCRPAAVLGCRRMLQQQRADQAAELRGDVQAHAAEGPKFAACAACTPCCCGRCSALQSWCAHASAPPFGSAGAGARSCQSHLCRSPARAAPLASRRCML